MKRWNVAVAVAVIVLSGLFLFGHMLKAKEDHFIEETFGFRKKDFKVVQDTDRHGGFHGDGDRVLILDCSENRDKALEDIAEWKKLPLSENLQVLLYRDEIEGRSYDYNFAGRLNIPEIKNGYYSFYDRHMYSKDAKDDTNVFRTSFNFSLALYDLDTDTMYILEVDT